MKIAKSIEYAATPEEVFAVLSDVKFQEAKCAATAAIKHSADVKTVGDHTVITTYRILPSDGLPDFAKSMVGETLKVTETQDWGPASADGSRRGTVEMAVAGAPIALKGTLAIAPAEPAPWSSSTPSSRRRCRSSAARSRRPPRRRSRKPSTSRRGPPQEWLAG